MQLASFDGKRYGGRFETEQEVGHGGMGAVYRARDLQTGEYVALKVLYERQGPNAERFEEEAAMLAELSHPAIVRYVQHGLTPGGEHFLAMEWLEGKNLEEALLAGPVPLADGLEMASRIMDALATAHRRGMVHRDLKPANIYLPQGKLTQAKLLDFGIARRLFDGRRLTRVGATVGTPMYMAPEQARGLSDVDARADVFSLGCVLFEALTGEPPFVAETPAAVLARICLEAAPHLRTRLPEAPEDVEALLARMLEKDRENRPGDSSALSRLLLKHADDLRFGPRATRTATDEDALIKVTPDESRLLAALVVELPRKGPMPSPAGAALASPPLAAGQGLTPVSLTAIRRLWRKSVDTPVPPPGQHTPTDRPALNAETLPDLFDEAILAKIVANLAPFGVHVEPFANGGLAIARPEGPASLDQVVDIARCALEMRRMLPMAVLAVASGRAKPGEADLPIGHVLERAGALLPGAPAGTIRLDPLTAELLTTRFEIQKVKDEHGADRRLMFEKGLRDPPRTLMGRPVPCLGREREITSIQSLFQQVVSDQQARVQILTGVAGVGKSRVRFEALERIYGLQLPFVMLTARAESFRANVAWALLGAALRGAADLSGHEAVEVARKRFSHYVGRRLKEPEARRRVVAFLGEIAGVHYPDEDFPLLASARQDPRAMSDQTRAAWLDWMEAELAAQPVLLVLEDLHWGDAASFHLVDAALRLFHDKPLMVVGFSRPELKQRFPGLWADRAVEHVALSPLTPKMTRKLVAAAYPGASPDLCEQLAERSDGNPFFVEELVRAHAERGLDVTDGAAPFSILALIQDRLDLYGENAKRVLRAASIYGQSFRRSAVAALLGSESLNDVEHWLEHLSDRELVYRRVQGAARDYGFRHGLVREAIYDTVTEEDRRLGHRLAAEFLERQGDEAAANIAEHFERAQLPRRAGPWYRLAGEQALGAGELQGALEAVDKALACQLEGEALGQLRLLEARVSFWLGNAERAEGAARDAESLLTGVARLEAVGELVVSLGCLVFEKGRGDREDDFRQWFERLRAMPESTLDPSRHNSALFRAGTYLFSSSDAKRWGWIEDLARLQRHQAAPACRAAALNVLSWAAALRSQWETSSELARCAADDFATAGNMQESLINRENAAAAMGVFGALEEAVKLSRDVVREASRHSGPLSVNSASANLAHLLLEAGHFEEAALVAEQCAQLCALHGHQRLEPFAWCTAARARLALNDFARAEESCLRAEASVAPSSPLVSVAHAVRVRLLLSSGSKAQAASAAQEMLESVDRLTASDFSPDELFVWATAALAFQEIKDEANLRHCINECLKSVEKRFRVSAGGVVGPEAAMRLSELEGLPASALPKMG